MSKVTITTLLNEYKKAFKNLDLDWIEKIEEEKLHAEERKKEHAEFRNNIGKLTSAEIIQFHDTHKGLQDTIELLCKNSRFETIHGVLAARPVKLFPVIIENTYERGNLQEFIAMTKYLAEPLDLNSKTRLAIKCINKAKDIPSALELKKLLEFLEVNPGELNPGISSSGTVITAAIAQKPELSKVLLPIALSYTQKNESFPAEFIGAAITANRLDLVKFGVEELKIDPSILIDDVPCIIHVIKSGPKVRIKIIEYLCELGCANDIANDGKSPLIYAIECGHLPAIKIIADAKGDLNHETPNGDTALSIALPRSDGCKVLKFLLQYPFDFNRRNKHGVVPLNTLVGRWQTNLNPEALKLSLTYGARVDIPMICKPLKLDVDPPFDPDPEVTHFFEYLQGDNLKVAAELVRQHLERPEQPAPIPQMCIELELE